MRPPGKKENLKPPFQKGQSGNPKGRPKGAVSLMQSLRNRLESNPELREELLDSLIERFKEGNATVINQIFDRLEGPRKELIEHSGSIDVSSLTDEERAAQTLAIFNAARERAAGQADPDAQEA